MKKAILLPDLHHPYHNKRAWKAVLSFIKWFRPNTIVLMGDALEMRAIDHWKKEKGNHRAFEGIRLLHDSLSKMFLNHLKHYDRKPERFILVATMSSGHTM